MARDAAELAALGIDIGGPKVAGGVVAPDGTVTKFTVVWDGSLLDDQTITALAADAADR